MYTAPVDYDASEVRALRIFLEQYIRYDEPNRGHARELLKVMAILRAVDTIHKGTQFLTKMANDEESLRAPVEETQHKY
jgi:hypothetical protein